MAHNEAVHQLFIDFEKAYDSVRREVLYNILIEFGIPRKLVRLKKMCLTEMYSRVRVGRNWSDRFNKKKKKSSTRYHNLKSTYTAHFKTHREI